MARRVLRVTSRLSFVRALRWVLWVLLAAAVILAVFPLGMTQRVEDGRLPRLVLLVPAIVFGGFLVAFAVYRFALVRAGRYNAGKAFLQVGLGILVLLLMAPPSLERYHEARGRVPQVDLGPLLSSADPAVRAAACEALSHRTDAPEEERAHARELAARDPDARVRAACAAVR